MNDPRLRRDTDSDGLPRAVACYWHGAHYRDERCPGPPPDDAPPTVIGHTADGTPILDRLGAM